MSKNTSAIKSESFTHTIYVRDDERTRTGFLNHEDATRFADSILQPNCMGSRDSEEMRVRVSFRRRTGHYDVVVKTAKRVTPTAKE